MATTPEFELPIRIGVKPWRFSLKAMMGAVGLVAAACAIVRYEANLPKGAAPILTIFAVPFLVCGAIGLIHGRIGTWLRAYFLSLFAIEMVFLLFMICLFVADLFHGH